MSGGGGRGAGLAARLGRALCALRAEARLHTPREGEMEYKAGRAGDRSQRDAAQGLEGERASDHNEMPWLVLGLSSTR